MNIMQLLRFVALGVAPQLLVAVGSSLFSLPAAAAVELYDVAFVERAGRAGHEGYFPIQGLPVQGTSAVVRVRLFGPVGTARVQFVSPSGVSVAAFPVLPGLGNDPSSPVFYGTTQIPYQAFRVVVQGNDQAGTVFEFDAPSAIVLQPTSVDVKLVPTLGQVVPNTSTVVYANITNSGATDTFSLTVADSRGNLAVPAIQSISLGVQQSAAVKISVVVPPGTPSSEPLAGYRLSLSARGINTGSANAGTIELPIATRAGQSVVVDIKPGSCRNPIETESSGDTPVAVLGFASFDPSTIDPTSIRLAGVVRPVKTRIEDVGSAQSWNCAETRRDRVPDLLLHFDTREMVDALRSQNPVAASKGQAMAVRIYMRARDGTEYIGYDEARLLKD
jgi:hypothetical protein